MSRGQTAVEINPKQVALGEGKVGNSVRGPLGVHLKSGERYPFIHPDGRPVATTLGGQLSYALAVPTVDVAYEVSRRPWLEEERALTLDRGSHDQDRTSALPGKEGPALGGSRAADAALRFWGPTLIEQWKEDHPLSDILARYGAERGRGGAYHCPLPHHAGGDQRPSLSVDAVRGVWYCHAARMGGSALDFVMAAEGLTTAAEAVAYLRGRGEIEPAALERAQNAEARARG